MPLVSCATGRAPDLPMGLPKTWGTSKDDSAPAEYDKQSGKYEEEEEEANSSPVMVHGEFA